MKKYIAPKFELIKFSKHDVLASSKPNQQSIDNEGWIYYPPRPTRPH